MEKIPQHVAIILDGNGRWAKSKGMPRNYGHAQGAKALEEIVESSAKIGIKYLTVYAFSTENWSRPDDEVKALMNLLGTYLKKCMKMSIKHNMKVRILGAKEQLTPELQKEIAQLEEVSRDFTGLNFQIALNYGSRDEMLRAMKKIAQDVKEEKLSPDEITAEVFSDYLDTRGIPDPDLLIRTSGEQRISNYLLWQIAYSELYFTNVPWPDFHTGELKKAVEAYASRDRRYGGVKEGQNNV